MISYRFRRRAFLTALSGGVGLKIMLRNLEGAAQGMKSPARLLVTHWPIGIVAGSSDSLFKATAGSVGGSAGLKPFADAGLGPDMTVFRGLTTAHLNSTASGGGHDQGMVTLATGVAAGGVRTNCCQATDAFSVAPSFEQILLKNVPALQRPGGFAGSIGDSRTDFGEVNAGVLSYATATQSVTTYQGATATENVPLLPTLSPMAQYTRLFASFVPGPGPTATGGASGGAGATGGAGGAGTPRNADATLKRLFGRKSVLDFAIEELNQLKTMAPSGARQKLTIHTDALRTAEASVVSAVNAQYPNLGAGGAAGGGAGSGGAGGSGSASSPVCGGCTVKPVGPPATMGQSDPSSRGSGNHYGNSAAMQDDAPVHAMVGKAHLDLLKAAFVCDLIRVGTFQWASAYSHVGFALYPGQTGSFEHHPTSHRIGTAQTTAAATVAQLDPVAQFLFAVQTWYYARTAENMVGWKNTVDACGNSLLDFTCVPFLSDVASVGHERARMAAMIIGGKKLGFVHNQYTDAKITINELWGTMAQAFGYTPTEPQFGAPVAGLWTAPA